MSNETYIEELKEELAAERKRREEQEREVRRLSIREGELLAARAEALGRAEQAEMALATAQAMAERWPVELARAEQAERERDEAREHEDAARKHTRFVETEWAKRFDEVDAARERVEADNAAKDKAFADYVYQHGVEHETRCPEDDTCDCELIVALNKAFSTHPGSAMLERMRALETIRERMRACRLASLGMTPAESMAFSRLMDAVSAYDALKVSHE